ncbi:MAG TPA: hypothetical protein VJ224_06000 [Thermoplasmata archaeon]|nr:hypothetical protein [Thermoplasmata archaeon]
MVGFGKGRGLSMDTWSDSDLNQMVERADYALATEDDGRVLLIPPQTIKDLITEFRRLRTELTAAPDGRPPP